MKNLLLGDMGCSGSRLLPEQPLRFYVVSLKRHEIATFILVSEEVLQTFRTPPYRVSICRLLNGR
jgi:hypothetical protein